MFFAKEPFVLLNCSPDRQEFIETADLFRSTAQPTTCNLLILANCFAQLLT
jgi:hypothetical protein